MKASKNKKQIFAQPVRKLDADEILKVAGGGPFEEAVAKTGGGQDNTGHTGFN